VPSCCGGGVKVGGAPAPAGGGAGGGGGGNGADAARNGQGRPKAANTPSATAGGSLRLRGSPAQKASAGIKRSWTPASRPWARSSKSALVLSVAPLKRGDGNWPFACASRLSKTSRRTTLMNLRGLN